MTWLFIVPPFACMVYMPWNFEPGHKAVVAWNIYWGIG
jgi:hypothetical protein